MSVKHFLFAFSNLVLLLFVSCSENKKSVVSPPNSSSALRPVATTAEGTNVDSPGIWISPKIEDSLVLLTEKGTGNILVFRADKSAALVAKIPGMKRPNGIAILADSPFPEAKNLAFVTDRDANTVQSFSLPEFQSLGILITDATRPMGISLYANNGPDVFAFIVPKEGEGTDRVLRYRIMESDGKIRANRDLAFGKELTVGQETVTVDADRKRVFVADEKAHDIKIYNIEGKFQASMGKGHFQSDVEWIAIADCNPRGYIIVSDQNEITEFEFFDRDSFQPLAMVRTTAMRTDGIALTTKDLPDS
jgi:hypothetical protein